MKVLVTLILAVVNLIVNLLIIVQILVHMMTMYFSALCKYLGMLFHFHQQFVHSVILSGVKDEVFDDFSKEVDYLMPLFTLKTRKIIVQETNKSAGLKIKTEQCTSSSHMNSWKKTEVGEIYVFLALMLNLCNKKRDMKQLWSTDPLLHSPISCRIMARERFIAILMHATFLQQCRPKALVPIS